MIPHSTTPSLLTVSQLTQAIKNNLEHSFSFVHLEGEISNFKVQSSGHLYFSLKDSGAQISVVMFKGSAALLKVIPKAGDHVIVKGELNVYPSKGNYQLIIRELSHVGLGELLQKLELLKIKLHQLGKFKAIHKKPLPKFPKIIGVITSPTGAVIQDILNILSRRFSNFHLILNPVKVQGEGAAQEITQAIKQFNLYQIADVLIIGRGGGSLEDLWPFNEEIVADAIFESTIPIISAVGHETDHCIADYVADVRAPTPSAAAEIVIAEKKQTLDYLSTIRKRIQQSVSHLVKQNHYRLEGFLKHPLFLRPHSLLEERMQKLDDIQVDLGEKFRYLWVHKKQQLDSKIHYALALNPINKVIHFRQHLFNFENSFVRQFAHIIAHNRQSLKEACHRLNQLWSHSHLMRVHQLDEKKVFDHLDQLSLDKVFQLRQKLAHSVEMMLVVDPKNILQKGYSIVFEKKGGPIIKSVQKLKQGQQVILQLPDGEALITINEILKKNST